MIKYNTVTPVGTFTRKSKREYSHIVVTVLVGDGKERQGFTHPDGKEYANASYSGRKDLAEAKRQQELNLWTKEMLGWNGYKSVSVKIYEAGRE